MSKFTPGPWKITSEFNGERGPDKSVSIKGVFMGWFIAEVCGDCLATTATDDASLWDDACERLLSWRSNPGQFDADDEPSIEILDTAIDFAVDERTRRGPAPTIIIPSGDHKVAFEWHYRRSTMIIDFVGRGRAKYTKFADGRVIEKGVLIRDLNALGGWEKEIEAAEAALALAEGGA